MVFVFILDNLKKDCGPVVNIAMSLAVRIREKGHKVFAVSRKNHVSELFDDYKNKFDGTFIVEDNYASELDLFKEKTGWDELGVLQKITCYLTNISILPAWFDWRFCHAMGQTKRLYTSMIEKTDGEIKPDVMISFMMPHWTEECLYKARIRSKRCLFQMDPYVHYEFTEREESLRRQSEEEMIAESADSVFVPPQIYREMQEDKFSIDWKKVKVYRFPGIRTGVSTDPETEKSNKEDIDIYFVGNFYEGIRNPMYTLSLFAKLPERFILHIVGKGAEEIVSGFKVKMGDRLVLHGVVPVEEAYRFMDKADILLNVGNTTDNQVPSKLIDYINTGRPIINICKIKSCPTLDYMNRYPLGFTLFEKEDVSETELKELVDFAGHNAGRRVKREDILRIYHDCTDEYVADQIIDSFSGLQKQE